LGFLLRKEQGYASRHQRLSIAGWIHMRWARVTLAGSLVAFGLLAHPFAARAASLPRSLELSAGWLFQPDPLDVGAAQGWQQPGFDRSGWRSVTVPAAWDDYDATLDGYEGVCWYAYRLSAHHIDPRAWQRLRFGRRTTARWCGSTARRWPRIRSDTCRSRSAATPRLHPRKASWIVVRVENGVRYDWLPGTTTVEWVQYGGLLEPVELLTTARTFIGHVAIDARPSGADADVNLTVTIESATDSAFAGRVLVDAGGIRTESPVRLAPRRAGEVKLELVIPSAKTWSPERPSLYDMNVRLLDGTREVDAVSERFGVRSIVARGRELLLNGSRSASAGSTATTSFRATDQRRASRRSAPTSPRSRPRARTWCACTSRRVRRRCASPTSWASSIWRRCRSTGGARAGTRRRRPSTRTTTSSTRRSTRSSA
jgi:hypothetical protein